MKTQTGYFETNRYRCLVYQEKQTDDLYLTLCGYEKCAPGYEFHTGQRTGYHLHVILGGKGVLCGVTMAFMADWRVGLCCLLTFLILLLLTRYVSLGSIVGAALCPVYLWVFGHEKLCIFLGALCALLIVIKHAENIVRLISGRESRIDLGGPRRKKEDDDFVDP